MNLIYAVLLLLYLIVGLVSFVTGLLVIVLRRTSWLFQTHLWAMLLVEASLIAVVAWNWSQLTIATQIVYVVLCLLGGFALFSSFQARQKQAYRYTGWRLEFMDDICITLIFIFGATAIIAAIHLGMPFWAGIALGVVGAISGRQWLQYEKRRYIADRKRYNDKKLRKG